MLHPELERLAHELRLTGHTVVPHGDHVCVRLSFFASVRVRMTPDGLRCEPRAGLLGRDASMFVSTGGSVALTTSAFALMGPGPLPFALGFASVVAVAVEAARVAVTEAAMTRVQMMYAMRRAGRVEGIADAENPALPAPAHASLAPAPPLSALAPLREGIRSPTP
jgi:hypothetical protein